MNDRDFEQRIKDHFSRYHKEDQAFATTEIPKAFEEMGDGRVKQAQVCNRLKDKIVATRQERVKEIHSLCQGDSAHELEGLKEGVKELAIRSESAVDSIRLDHDEKRDVKEAQREAVRIGCASGQGIEGTGHATSEALNRLTAQILIRYGDLRRDLQREEEEKINRLRRELDERQEALEETEERQVEPFTHSDNYRSVSLRGQTWKLSTRQAKIVNLLHKAYLNEQPELATVSIMLKIESPYSRWVDTFQKKKSIEGVKAMGTLIVPGSTPGTVRLNI